jgi:hypothetical protein
MAYIKVVVGEELLKFSRILIVVNNLVGFEFLYEALEENFLVRKRPKMNIH